MNMIKQNGASCKQLINMKKNQKKIILKDIRHSKGTYFKEQQALDIATLMIGRGMTQAEASALIKARYR